jgi:hypothetical protein
MNRFNKSREAFDRKKCHLEAEMKKILESRCGVERSLEEVTAEQDDVVSNLEHIEQENQALIQQIAPLTDEDIPTLVPSSPLNDDQTIAAKKVPTNDIWIGPITRARAKLLEQQVNLFLVEPDVFINENFILPNSWCVCILRFEQEGIVKGEEL